MLTRKCLLRLVRRLDVAWAAGTGPPDLSAGSSRLAACWMLVERALHRYQLARTRGLTLNRPLLAADLVRHLDGLARAAADVRSQFPDRERPVPEIQDWVGDVRQIENELGPLSVRWRDSVMRAVTDPIRQRGVDLGRFAIEFGWTQAGSPPTNRGFAAIALDPNPAAGRDEVPHPHVQGTDVCLGDAARQVARALAAGRLTDAFLLVCAVLTTYNPASAYVPLEAWRGQFCADCERRIDREDALSCERCHDAVCESCLGSCSVCTQSRCPACLEPCAACDAACCPSCLETHGANRRVCPGCVASCTSCERPGPADELTANTRRCVHCVSIEEDESDAGAETTESVVGSAPRE